MYNMAVSSAISGYRKANGLYNVAFERKNQVQKSPMEKSDIKSDISENPRKFDSFEYAPESIHEDENTKGIDYYMSKARAAAHQAQSNYLKNASEAAENSKKTENAENVKGKTFFINGEEVDEKKIKELEEAYAYFRKAACSNGYTVVKSSNDDGFSYCIRSGKKSVIMIDPEFMSSIRDNPEALKRYADEIETMKRLDKQFERQAKQQGKTVVSRGWRIEKDGSISSWSVVKTEHKAKKGQLQLMNELRDKILKKKMKKKKEDAALQEKRSKRKEELLRLEGRKKAAAKENLKRRVKKVRIYDPTRFTPKKYPGSGKTYSVSISCGSSPSLLTGNKLSGK